MNYTDLRGIFLPNTTPFTPEGSISYSDLRQNLEAWNQKGIRGHVLLGPPVSAYTSTIVST
jgi:dihydrodipicolinate synthase/N-acetylneuraminate lyase